MPSTPDPLSNEDLQLALYCCYELHYRGLQGVVDDWEWEPSLVAVSSELEARFIAELERLLPSYDDRRDAVRELWELAAPGGGISLSAWLVEHGTERHARELAVHRSGYQLKEADPHTWGIPRLSGEAKAAMVSIQTDEYGNGDASRMHASLFAETMRALSLNPDYGAYIDQLPAETLATSNLISLFGLHRRWRGALVGHLALFEMTSVGPMGRYDEWLEKIGVGEAGRRFYVVHVMADELHQDVAANSLVGGLLRSEPDLARDVLFGAQALALVERRFADHLLRSWADGVSSLRAVPLEKRQPQGHVAKTA